MRKSRRDIEVYQPAGVESVEAKHIPRRWRVTQCRRSADQEKHRQYQSVGPHMLIDGEEHDFAEIAAIYLEFGHQRESKVTP